MAKPRESRVMSRAMTRARQYVCGLHGHDALLRFEPHRVSLQCTSCGYETPGWDLKPVIACEDADVTVRQGAQYIHRSSTSNARSLARSLRTISRRRATEGGRQYG